MCQECHATIELGEEWRIGWGALYFCSRDCADFFIAAQDAEDLKYVKRSLGMAECDG